MKKLLFVVALMLFAGHFVFADSIIIKHFEVKENPFADSEVAIVATDSLGNIQENVDGVFSFTINGFEEQLQFQKGTAFYRHKLDKSAFFYAKHINDAGTH